MFSVPPRPLTGPSASANQVRASVKCSHSVVVFVFNFANVLFPPFGSVTEPLLKGQFTINVDSTFAIKKSSTQPPSRGVQGLPEAQHLQGSLGVAAAEAQKKLAAVALQKLQSASFSFFFTSGRLVRATAAG